MVKNLHRFDPRQGRIDSWIFGIARLELMRYLHDTKHKPGKQPHRHSNSVWFCPDSSSVNFNCPVFGVPGPTYFSSPWPDDGRLNTDAGATVVRYCSSDDNLAVYGIDNEGVSLLALHMTEAELNASPAALLATRSSPASKSHHQTVSLCGDYLQGSFR